MNVLKAPLAAALLLVLTSCDPLLQPDRGSFAAEVRGAEIVLSNGTSAPVFFFVIEEGTLPMANWAPCIHRDRCTYVDAGGEYRFPAERVVGYRSDSPQQTVLIFWWHSVRDRAGGERAGPVQSLAVQL